MWVKKSVWRHAERLFEEMNVEQDVLRSELNSATANVERLSSENKLFGDIIRVAADKYDCYISELQHRFINETSPLEKAWLRNLLIRVIEMGIALNGHGGSASLPLTDKAKTWIEF